MDNWSPNMQMFTDLLEGVGSNDPPLIPVASQPRESFFEGLSLVRPSPPWRQKYTSISPHFIGVILHIPLFLLHLLVSLLRTLLFHTHIPYFLLDLVVMPLLILLRTHIPHLLLDLLVMPLLILFRTHIPHLPLRSPTVHLLVLHLLLLYLLLRMRGGLHEDDPRVKEKSGMDRRGR